MTKKDYVLIAGALREARMHFLITPTLDGASFRAGLEAGAVELALALSSDNQKFDRTRFLAACGVTQ